MTLRVYQAYATGGFKSYADTPRGAAINFFTAFPTKRKCNIIQGEHDGRCFTVTYGRTMPKMWHDVTKRTLADLPDTLTGEQ